jgi:hypothetical protein
LLVGITPPDAKAVLDTARLPATVRSRAPAAAMPSSDFLLAPVSLGSSPTSWTFHIRSDQYGDDLEHGRILAAELSLAR